MRKYKKRKVQIADVSDTRAHKVITLHRDKVSGRSIARSLGIGRNTVRKVLAEHDEERKDGAPLIQEQPASTRPTKLDAHKDTIARLLERYPDITSQRVFEDLRKLGYDGGYTMVCERVAHTGRESICVGLVMVGASDFGAEDVIGIAVLGGEQEGGFTGRAGLDGLCGLNDHGGPHRCCDWNSRA